MGMYIHAPIEEGNPHRTLIINVSGKLTEHDYDQLIERTNELVAHHGKINMLVELSDFDGWTAGAAWEDLKYGMEHFSHIERMALIGESIWEKGMALFIKPFTSAEVRYFDRTDSKAAYNWVDAQEPDTTT